MNEHPSISSAAAAPRVKKALLICALAEELSGQCTNYLRDGGMDRLLDLQSRKHSIIEELAALLRDLDVAALPDLHRAVERLRAALRTETSALAEASAGLQDELISVNAAQRRLTHARRYDTAAMSPAPFEGRQLSVSG